MPRLFTRKEADALLPVLNEKLGQLGELRDAAAPRREALARLEAKAAGNGRDHAEEMGQLRRELQSLIARSEAILTEILGLGVEVKDLQLGLVDFPSEREGRVVYLCWRLGEDRVRFWHEVDAGFAGRQPLEES